VDNDNVLMRHIITKEDADKLIDTIPEIKADAFYGSEVRQISEHYESIIRTRDCAKLIELTMSIYEKKQYLATHNRKFGSQEEMFMKRAEEILYDEFAAALDIPRKHVKGYIEARVNEKVGKTEEKQTY
jgi:CarD family transcriptional regulator